jgi:hypothetical protein
VNEQAPVRIAMWSGPRNISTAMMRAWENREDTFVVDEPFYAYYLQKTGADHPIADEVIADGETDWRKVVDRMIGEIPDGKRIYYQKQMTHHLLAEVDRAWLKSVTNCFLIRDPREVIASYLKKNHEPVVEDLGFVQQSEIFDAVRKGSNTTPPVVDARDVLENPERILRLLCAAIAVPFDEAMLSWPRGRRATDGIWAKHWYGEVEQSTSFQPYRGHTADVPERLRAVCESCLVVYERLHALRLH